MVKYNKDELSLIFHALADPTRRKMLRMISRGDRQATNLASPFKMSLPAVSKHIRILERAGFVDRRIRGRVHWICFNEKAMKKAFNWVKFYGKFWNEKLDHLDKFLKETVK